MRTLPMQRAWRSPAWGPPEQDAALGAGGIIGMSSMARVRAVGHVSSPRAVLSHRLLCKWLSMVKEVITLWGDSEVDDHMDTTMENGEVD